MIRARYIFEICMLTLFAVVISFICSSVIHMVQHKKMPQYHTFNNEDILINSFFTALLATCLARFFQFQEVFKQF